MFNMFVVTVDLAPFKSYC